MWRRYPFRCLAYVLVIAGSAIGAIVAVSQGYSVLAVIAGVVLLLALFRFVPWWLRMRNTRMIITDRRCILETGVFHRASIEFQRGDLIDVQVAQSGLMPLFDVGDLVISSDVDARKQFVLMAVPHPAVVAEHLRDLNINHPRQPQQQPPGQPQPA
jgi:hypothetical protein